jgi:hypothetical protein
MHGHLLSSLLLVSYLQEQSTHSSTLYRPACFLSGEAVCARVHQLLQHELVLRFRHTVPSACIGKLRILPGAA